MTRGGYLFLVTIPMSIVSIYITYADQMLYPAYASAPRLWGISAERDQNFGGILMNVEQAFVFLAAILYFVVKLIPDEEQMRAS